MCRLFGLSSAPQRVHATFWLLQAPDSLEQQSRANPDGTGVGAFRGDGSPLVLRQPVAAWKDADFALEAQELESATFVAHVRFASTGGHTVANTHPFEQQGRLFAHNGVVEGLDLLDARLAELGGADLVLGQTDSERFFALITRETARHGGDVGAGITAAAQWAAQHLPVFCLNLVLTTPDDLWALRYPDTHELHVLDRTAEHQRHGTRENGTHRSGEPLDHRDARNQVRAHSADLADTPYVVVASEPMDQDPGWRAMRPGELLHVAPGPRLHSTIALSDPPVHPLTAADLHPRAAASQAQS